MDMVLVTGTRHTRVRLLGLEGLGSYEPGDYHIVGSTYEPKPDHLQAVVQRHAARDFNTGDDPAC